MSQPSLRITYHEARPAHENYVFDVWNPLSASYESAPNFEAAMAHVQRLAQTVHDLWVARDEQLARLPGPPPPVDGAEFAEFKVTAQAQRHYDIRSFDSPEWTHFRGYMSQAAEHISGEVGYVLAPSPIPRPPAHRLQAKSA